MLKNRTMLLLYSVALLSLAPAWVARLTRLPTLEAQMKGRVFELRTYTAPDGKLSDLHKRFRDHTLRIFEKHGMTNIGYWMPAGRAAVAEHDDLSDRAPEPGSGARRTGASSRAIRNGARSRRSRRPTARSRPRSNRCFSIPPTTRR